MRKCSPHLRRVYNLSLAAHPTQREAVLRAIGMDMQDIRQYPHALLLEDAKIQVFSDHITEVLLRQGINPAEIHELIECGSGLGSITDQMEILATMQCADVPCFPRALDVIPGHEGSMVVGRLEGKLIFALKGRVHCYQGLEPFETVRPLRAIERATDLRRVVLTNAAGFTNRTLVGRTTLKVGDIVLIHDFINLTGRSALLGPNLSPIGERFVPMLYSSQTQLFQEVQEAARENDGIIPAGTYVCMPGPEYETPSTIDYIRIIRGAEVGMSTVFGIVALEHINSGRRAINEALDMLMLPPGQPPIQMIALSSITNAGAGLSTAHPCHKDVEKVARQNAEKIFRIYRTLLRRAA